jgi:hypothetical protein
VITFGPVEPVSHLGQAARDAGSILRDVLGWKYVAEDWDNRVNPFASRGSSLRGDQARWVCTRRGTLIIE